MATLKRVPSDDPIRISQAGDTLAQSLLLLFQDADERMNLAKRFLTEHPVAFARLASLWKEKCKEDQDDMADWEFRMTQVQRNRHVMEVEIGRYPTSTDFKKLFQAFGHINAQRAAIELTLGAS